MLHLVTAVPGSGKTFWCINKMLDLAKNGETIYTNINGCTIPGIEPLPEDYDLTVLPDGSFVFIDEAQKIERFAAKGRQPLSSDPVVKFFEVHRHRGFEIYLITQDPEFLHKHILKLVGHHVALERPMGSRFPVVHEWSMYQSRPDTKAAKKKADAHYNMALKKSVYQYYTSTVKDTHKFQWGSFGRLIALPVLGIIFILYMFFGTDNVFLHPGGEQKPDETQQAQQQKTSQQAQQLQQAQPVNTAPAQPQQGTSQGYDVESHRVAFVSRSSTYCRAFDGNGNIMLDIQLPECEFLSDNPMFIKAMNKGMKQQLNPAAPAPVATSSIDTQQTGQQAGVITGQLPFPTLGTPANYTPPPAQVTPNV